MSWRISFPRRETMQYDCEEGIFFFEMTRGGDVPHLYVTGNTLFREDGAAVEVNDRTIDLLEARVLQHCHAREDTILILLGTLDLIEASRRAWALGTATLVP